MAKKKDKKLSKLNKELKEVRSDRSDLKKALKKLRKREKKISEKIDRHRERKASAEAVATVPSFRPPDMSADGQGDNLRKLRGLGPKIEQYLHEAGIYTYAQLLRLNKEEWLPILRAAGPRYRSYDPTPWREQARQLSSRHDGSIAATTVRRRRKP